MIEEHPNAIVGKGGIWAAVVADSVNPWGDRVTTFRLHYPRMIHSEFMTHRVFSRNASSSRAIPVNKVIEQVLENPAMPVHWGKNKPGMQADEENDSPIVIQLHDMCPPIQVSPEEAWEESAKAATEFAQAFADAGYHKQVVNRLLEPYQFMNTVASATDWNNFFWLRYHEDADPNIKELARVIYEAYVSSRPETLRHGEWHTPYVQHERDENGVLHYVSEGVRIDVEDAKKISASCSAQASYRKLDTSLEKARKIYERLVEMKPIHASPFEHVATPMSEDEYIARKRVYRELASLGIANIQGVMYAGNFKGWVQLRKTIPDENIEKTFTPAVALS